VPTLSLKRKEIPVLLHALSEEREYLKRRLGYALSWDEDPPVLEKELSRPYRARKQQELRDELSVMDELIRKIARRGGSNAIGVIHKS
jgi:hypothetical protein